MNNDFEDCHLEDTERFVKKSSLVSFTISVCVQNLQSDNNPPKEYHDLAEKILALSNHQCLGPEIKFEIKLSPDNSYTATVITPTEKYPFPDRQSYKFKGQDYYKCLENQCFEKIVLDMFNLGRDILNREYIDIL